MKISEVTERFFKGLEEDAQRQEFSGTDVFIHTPEKMTLDQAIDLCKAAEHPLQFIRHGLEYTLSLNQIQVTQKKD